MNPEEIRASMAQGRLRYEPEIGFTIDGAIVTDAADHAVCARVLGLLPAPPFRDLAAPARHLLPSAPPAPAPPPPPTPEAPAHGRRARKSTPPPKED